MRQIVIVAWLLHVKDISYSSFPTQIMFYSIDELESSVIKAMSPFCKMC